MGGNFLRKNHFSNNYGICLFDFGALTSRKECGKLSRECSHVLIKFERENDNTED